MTRRELAAVLVLLATVLILAALWPSPTKSDQPAVSVVPASEFVAIRSAGPIDRDNPHPALPQPRITGTLLDRSPGGRKHDVDLIVEAIP
jgi:hypothetical protein